MLRSLEQLMLAYPTYWDPSTVKSLLSEIAELDDERLPEKLSGTLLHLKRNLLEPLFEILVMQRNLIDEERHRAAEKEQHFILTMRSLQAERNDTINRFQQESDRRSKQNVFVDGLLRDMDNMTKAIEQSRQSSRQAKRALLVKEAELSKLLDNNEYLLRKAVSDGPQALLDWVKIECEVQGLNPGSDFESRWMSWMAAAESVEHRRAQPCQSEEKLSQVSNGEKEDDNTEKDDGQDFRINHLKDWLTGKDGEKCGFLWVVASIVLQEILTNSKLVLERGLFFVPMAWFYFWMGTSGRVSNYVGREVLYRLRQLPLFSFFI